ncbi:hypothetical protein C5167_003843 [Papaver somniferum]|uniref:Uncharacterized protein n=1 Tax=Papaver somniferum TaxID=3469 RepID=A0A4Y7KYT4_PAPSO|nr:hypothetical protein C5167_003843 [Papaver somniferum]
MFISAANMPPKDAYLNVSSRGSMARRKRREKEKEKQPITKPNPQNLHVDVLLRHQLQHHDSLILLGILFGFLKRGLLLEHIGEDTNGLFV